MTAYARDRSSLGYGWRKSERKMTLRRIPLIDPLEETHLAPPATPGKPAS